MKQHLKIAACYFRLNLASALEYRASFLGQAVGMAVSNSSFLFFWWVAFAQMGGSIAGYAFRDVLFIWSLASAAFGLSNILFANVSQLTRLIVSGELDAFLLQPCNVLVNVACARTTLSAYGDLGYGLVLMCLSHWGNAAAWGWFCVGTLAGSLLMAAILLAAHSLTFFFGNTAVLGQLITEFLINFSVYPEKMYGPSLRLLMYTLIPVGFVVHVPLRLSHQFSLWWAALFPLAALLYCALASLLFFRGLRRYESGNAIVTRL